MSSLPLVFDFNEKPVRIIKQDGAEWWVASDLCKVLELGNPTETLKRLDEDERALILIEGTPGNVPSNVVSEAGMFSLVLSSRKPEAKAFKRWVTHEVLPALRKRELVPSMTDPYAALVKLATDMRNEQLAMATTVETLSQRVSELDGRVNGQMALPLGYTLRKRGDSTERERRFRERKRAEEAPELRGPNWTIINGQVVNNDKESSVFRYGMYWPRFFLETHCLMEEAGEISCNSLYGSYLNQALGRKRGYLSRNAFDNEIERRFRLKREKSKGTTRWIGVAWAFGMAPKR